MESYPRVDEFPVSKIIFDYEQVTIFSSDFAFKH